MIGCNKKYNFKYQKWGENMEKHKTIENMKFDKSKTMTIKEFHEEYNLGINKAYEIVHAKGFPMVKVGRKILILRSRVDDWFEQNIGAQF